MFSVAQAVREHNAERQRMERNIAASKHYAMRPRKRIQIKVVDTKHLNKVLIQ